MRIETSDLARYVKERHRQTVRKLSAKPILAILVTGDEAASTSFIRAKRRYGEDIGVEVVVEAVKTPTQATKQIKAWNDQSSITGIVVQLPLPATFDADQVIARIAPVKEVDGLGAKSQYEPATARAIMWILTSLGLNLKESTICVVGQGRLVGAPVSAMLEASGAKVRRCDIKTKDLAAKTKAADIVISGVGHPRLIKRSMLGDDAVVIDAGTSEAAGKLAGDVDPSLYDDPSIRVTPVPGGVGPMTVAALFDNLLIAAQA
jgi:methylenetetrahydrofolate dehydrogenase (NADP+)/methenyltetrahydrofolate cyclohydrolase